MNAVKCLSVRQPWADLILDNAPGWPYSDFFSRPKDVENRTWRTAYMGPMLIHAGQQVDRGEMERWNVWGQTQFERGAILGYVTLLGCYQDFPSPWAMPGQWHWLLGGPTVFETPIPYKGRLGLFNVPVSALEGQWP